MIYPIVLEFMTRLTRLGKIACRAVGVTMAIAFVVSVTVVGAAFRAVNFVVSAAVRFTCGVVCFAILLPCALCIA